MNKDALQERINEYNKEVKKIFNYKINGKRRIPYLLNSYIKSYNELDITELKYLLDQQLCRYEKIMALLDGYMLGSGQTLHITYDILDSEFIPKLPKENEFLLKEYGIIENAYPNKFISILHII